ncbi:hypothetical protein [Streptomyces sp. NBC_01408]|uniref:hypothetical protein n=1 Tax=Streptomyces sp. NBC_01408 TaxID=2903855 RepID=UPI00224FF9FD|nr:hypothetical protein [Streptomyces sp. NBC_01408]MCX4693935.1 hypothetical protein [Streptomyces sp. NBC_01408]
MGSGPAPRSARTAGAAAALTTALALGITTLTLGCSPGAARAPATGPPAPAPHTTSSEELCVSLLTHWSGVLLDAEPGQDPVGRDYQAMGLSGDQYDILRAVVASARTETQTRGRDAGRDLADRQIRLRCAERHRGGDPTGSPW